MRLDIFPPGTTSFGGGAAAGESCAGYRLFTPTVSGRWSFLISAGPDVEGSQPYWLHVEPASSLEMAPGIFLPNFAHYTATLHGNLDTDVRLFRFDVTTFSDLTLFLQTASDESFDLKLLNDQGKYLECDCGSQGEETIRREMQPGRYFVVVQAENFESGPFTLSRESRTITHVQISFDGFGYEQISPGTSTRITATVSPAVDGPVTFELEYFDPVATMAVPRLLPRRGRERGGRPSLHAARAGTVAGDRRLQRYPQRSAGDERLGRAAGRRPAHSIAKRPAERQPSGSPATPPAPGVGRARVGCQTPPRTSGAISSVGCQGRQYSTFVADVAASGVCAGGLVWTALGMRADRSGARRRLRLGSVTLLGALPQVLDLSARKLCHQRGRCYASYRRPRP